MSEASQTQNTFILHCAKHEPYDPIVVKRDPDLFTILILACLTCLNLLLPYLPWRWLKTIRHKRKAKRLYQSNLSSCGLCRFPSELLLYIVENHISDCDALCLAVTCRHFRYCLWKNTYLGLFRFFRRVEYTQRIRRDQFQLLAAAEERAIIRTSKVEEHIACSACFTTHPRSFFSESQVAACPFTRICLGKQGIIRVADLFKTNFDELKLCKYRSEHSFQLRYRNGALLRLACVRMDIIQQTPRQHWYFLNSNIDEKHCWIIGEYPYFSYLRRWEVPEASMKRLRIAMLGHNIMICSHIRTSDEEFLDQIRDSADNWLTCPKLGDCTDCDSKCTWAMKVKCTHPNCDTICHLRRKDWMLDFQRMVWWTSVQLFVSRNLGLLEHPNHDEFLGQLEYIE